MCWINEVTHKYIEWEFGPDSIVSLKVLAQFPDLPGSNIKITNSDSSAIEKNREILVRSIEADIMVPDSDDKTELHGRVSAIAGRAFKKARREGRAPLERGRAQHGPAEDQGIVDSVEALHVDDRERQGPLGFVVDHDERPVVAVPHPDEGEDQQGGHDGHCHRDWGDWARPGYRYCREQGMEPLAEIQRQTLGFCFIPLRIILRDILRQK
jgi:hypothetical protein